MFIKYTETIPIPIKSALHSIFCSKQIQFTNVLYNEPPSGE